jgi:hypothetical protein
MLDILFVGILFLSGLIFASFGVLCIFNKKFNDSIDILFNVRRGDTGFLTDKARYLIRRYSASLNFIFVGISMIAVSFALAAKHFQSFL